MATSDREFLKEGGYIQHVAEQKFGEENQREWELGIIESWLSTFFVSENFSNHIAESGCPTRTRT